MLQHPVLLPLALLGGALLTGIASLNGDNLFPFLALINVSSTYLCLSLACILGTAGIVVSIIGILEHIDRSIPVAISPKE
ncbi:MAG: hypothetical protein IMW89_04215 [Ktedonobacteraceae bacterium]|nr:hypothetical protein [Ktedonobacteraceae bacterium]